MSTISATVPINLRCRAVTILQPASETDQQGSAPVRRIPSCAQTANIAAIKPSLGQSGVANTAVTYPERRFVAVSAVEVWLWTLAALVFAMVVVGGATRLTGSGLSITEWQPLLGAIPPLNEADWQVAFEKYKQIPQYRLVNEAMTIESFKFIYAWEWSHRLLGRLIGVVAALPLIYFAVTGRLRRGLAAKLGAVVGLGALQGAIGWFMVSSGLADRVDVSQYRLALHLTTALVIFSILIWLALDEASLRQPAILPQSGNHLKALAAGLLALVFLQVILGAFVAGLKAGRIYNTWPLMDGYWFPPDYVSLTSPWLSFFESHAAAQFNHRLTAYAVAALALFQAAVVFRSPVSSRFRMTSLAVLAAVFLQAISGIVTLLWQVPLGLGLLHQAGGALVLAAAVWHLHATVRTSSEAR